MKKEVIMKDGIFLKRHSNVNAVKLTQLLAAEGIPVAEYIRTANGSMTDADGYFMITKIAGTHPDLFAQPYLAEELGRGLGRLHMALARIEPHFDGCRDNNFMDEWHNYILPGLDDSVPDCICDNIGEKLSEIYPALPRQLIHRDVHSNNVLFEGGRLIGWIDFDLHHRDARIFDIAYLLAGLIIGHQQNPEKVEIWQQVYDLLLSTYNEVNPLSAVEQKSLPLIMTAVEMLFVSFWNRAGNEHQKSMASELAKWLYGRLEN